MRVMILNSDYDSFLRWLYGRNPGLENTSNANQLVARVDSLFGVADSYSRGFEEQGHPATEIFFNNIWMQSAWAREHGLSVPQPPSPLAASEPPGSGEFVTRLKRRLRPYRKFLAPIGKKLGYVQTLKPIERKILMAQIEDFNPDIILNQELEIIGSDILKQVKRPGRTIIAQCGNEPPADFDAAPYDFGISLIPWVVEFYRARGLPGYLRNLAFDPMVNEKLGPPPPKDVELSFVGGVSAGHGKRLALLEAIAQEFPIQLWLSNFKGIPANSPLHKCVRGEVWGRDMYDVLRRSKITLNTHIDAARGMAGNMRLYEATGVGTFLLTENLPNLPTLFEPGVHVGAYDSVEDCLAKVRYYLAHDAEREAIARAGQAHTLSVHTYPQRIQEILKLVAKHGR